MFKVGQVKMLVPIVLQSFLLFFLFLSLSEGQALAYLVHDSPLLFVSFDDFGLVLDCLDNPHFLSELSKERH